MQLHAGQIVSVFVQVGARVLCVLLLREMLNGCAVGAGVKGRTKSKGTVPNACAHGAEVLLCILTLEIRVFSNVVQRDDCELLDSNDMHVCVGRMHLTSGGV